MRGEAGYQMGKNLRDMFPEQTKSIPAIIVWTIIIVLDVALVIWLLFQLGINPIGMRIKLQSVLIAVYLIAALAVFWVETFIYNKIVSLFR